MNAYRNKAYQKPYAIASIICIAAALGGCHTATETNGVPTPATHAAPSAQEQMKQIDDNPHIPDTQKAQLKAQIANGGGTAPTPPPAR